MSQRVGDSDPLIITALRWIFTAAAFLAGVAGSLALLVGAAVGAATGPGGATFNHPITYAVLLAPTALGTGLAYATYRAFDR